MAHMPQSIEKTRQELESRLEEIKPKADELVAEVKWITDTIVSIDAHADGSNGVATKSGRRTRRSSGRGRPRGTGGRAQEVLKILQDSDEPLSVAQIAHKMDLDKPNYLYRVLPPLQEDGKVTRHPDGTFTSESA